MIGFGISFGGGGSLKRSVSFLLTCYLSLKELEGPLFILIRLELRGLSFFEVRFGLGERFFEWPRVDLKKRITFFTAVPSL